MPGNKFRIYIVCVQVNLSQFLLLSRHCNFRYINKLNYVTSSPFFNLFIIDVIFSLFHPDAAIVLCLPADVTGETVVKVIDGLHLPRDHNSLAIFMDVATLPSWKYTITSNSTPFLLETPEAQSNTTTINISGVSAESVKSLLFFTDIESFNESWTSVTVKNIVRTLSSLNGTSSELAQSLDDQFGFLLADLRLDNSSLRPLLVLKCFNGSGEFDVEKIMDNLDEWSVKHKQLDEIDNYVSEFEKALSVLIILACSCLFVSVILGAAAIARNQLLKKRVAKGPYKVLLTATDFVFPQIADSRRVSIGIILHKQDIFN